jgi:bifunctional lysine-specific demethylase and histidyl-hydroxylase NO66
VSLSSVEYDSPGRSPLQRCTGDAQAFVRSSWGTQAAVYPRADSDGFEDLLSLDDVDRFLTTTALRAPYFRVVKAGERIDESAYTRAGRTGSRDVHGMVDPAALASLFEDGATIVLQGLHRWSEPVTRFNRDLELELGHPCQVNAYITPPGAQGLDRHVDPHDVFVLQAFGRKRWEIHAAPGEEAREPLEVEVLAGDAVYMPAGTPHAAAAQEVASGHLTVGVHVTPWRSVLREVASLAADRLEGVLPAGWHVDPARHAAELAGMLEQLAADVRSTDASGIMRARSERFWSQRAQLARGSVVERAGPLVVTEETRVSHRDGSICRLSVYPDRLVVLLGDRKLEMPTWLEPAMRRISNAQTFAVGDLSGEVADASSRAVLVRRLIREGLLTVRRPRPSPVA